MSWTRADADLGVPEDLTPSPDASEPDRRRPLASHLFGWAVRDLNP